MPKRPKLVRTSITIPSDVLAQADQLAQKLDRSRSWVLAEGVRRLAREGGAVAAAPTLREPAVHPYAGHEAEMEAARLRRLRADLAATPEQRLHDAEQLVRLARMVRPPRNRTQIIGFDSYEDYDRWKTTQWAGG